MKYHSKKPKKQPFLKGGSSQISKSSRLKKALLTALPIIALISGIYLLSLAYAPKLVPLFKSGQVEAAINDSAPDPNQDRLYIKKLGVNVQIKTGGPETMKTGVWHRFPELGDPVKGGNFIVSAHRWKTGKTPAETIAQSPFYNADRLQAGDEMFVDFQGKRYRYQIYETFQIKPNQTEIEDPAPEGQAYLTLYTCTLGGSSDGRVVIRARLATVN